MGQRLAGTGLILCFLVSCNPIVEPIDEFSPAFLERVETYVQGSIQFSDGLYDGAGSGHWGHTALGYRLPLRNSSFRSDAYRALASTLQVQYSGLLEKADSTADWFTSVQDEVTLSPTAHGLMFLPYEPDMPEFGTEMLADFTFSSDAVFNGWYVLPNDAGNSSGKISSAFYEHGRALLSLCRSYESGDTSLTGYIGDAADWLVSQAATAGSQGGYVNYFGAGVEGLARAWLVTGTQSYLDTAVSWAQSFILDEQNPDGSFGGSHDQLARYHAFILSSLGQLLYSLPAGHALIPDLQQAIADGRTYMEIRTSLQDPDQGEYDWTGICARVWAEMEILARRDLVPPLSPAEKGALSHTMDVAIEHIQPGDYSGYNRLKAGYHAEQAAWVVSVFKYDSLYY